MAARTKTRLPEILQKYEDAIRKEWVAEQMNQAGRQKALMREDELEDQCRDFLNILQESLQTAPLNNFDDPAWQPMREFLTDVSRSRTEQGFTPTETAVFVYSFKRALFGRLRTEFAGNAEALADETWAASELVDKFGLFTTEMYQKTRESIIHRQQEEMLELSTPVVKLWDGILALPLIGTLDSARTQVVMESLLQRIVDTGSNVAIIDITGVPTVDTLVAQHLLKTVTAARLMGADCIISGIRPQIAQTIVHLGVALGDVVTKGNLADAFALALKRLGVRLVQKPMEPQSEKENAKPTDHERMA